MNLKNKAMLILATAVLTLTAGTMSPAQAQDSDRSIDTVAKVNIVDGPLKFTNDSSESSNDFDFGKVEFSYNGLNVKGNKETPGIAIKLSDERKGAHSWELQATANAADGSPLTNAAEISLNNGVATSDYGFVGAEPVVNSSITLVVGGESAPVMSANRLADTLTGAGAWTLNFNADDILLDIPLGNLEVGQQDIKINWTLTAGVTE